MSDAGPPLSLATIPDIVAELERRHYAVAVVVSQAIGEPDWPGPDVPPENCKRVYANETLGMSPVQVACFLCSAVKWVVTAAFKQGQYPGLATADVWEKVDSLCADIRQSAKQARGPS
jgi:hypothetical protein